MLLNTRTRGNSFSTISGEPSLEFVHNQSFNSCLICDRMSTVAGRYYMAFSPYRHASRRRVGMQLLSDACT